MVLTFINIFWLELYDHHDPELIYVKIYLCQTSNKIKPEVVLG